MSYMVKDQGIREILKDAGIAVPRNQAEQYGMGFSYGRKITKHQTHCSVCGLPILKGDFQLEFMAGRYGPNARPYLHHLHRGCFISELVRMFEEEGDDLLKAILAPVDDIIPKVVLARLKGNGHK